NSFSLLIHCKIQHLDLDLEEVLIAYIDAHKGDRYCGIFWIHVHNEYRHSEEECLEILADYRKILEDAKEKNKKWREEIQAEIQTEKLHRWSQNELRPIAREGHSTSIFEKITTGRYYTYYLSGEETFEVKAVQLKLILPFSTRLRILCISELKLGETET
ncbi:Mannosyl-oligosaccharide 1,2-alpha-mannosidase IB, partial [Galemys pyrenaicus]